MRQGFPDQETAGKAAQRMNAIEDPDQPPRWSVVKDGRYYRLKKSR